MKRVLALVLAVVMLVFSLASCSSLSGDDKGAVITMYLADEIYDFDPMSGYTDSATAKLISLVFEGLTRLDDAGNWEKAMMKSYKVIKPEAEGDNYKIQITLRDSKWSDGRTVQANDFVYAWKRILEPTNKCEAASMLFDVKNARDIKMGDATVDDLGVYAVETYVLEIEFEKEVDPDEFFRTCASVALVPLREDKVGNDDTWAKRASTMVTNGPFDVRKIDYGKLLRLERSSYYYRDTESNQALDKYVTPYRLEIMYSYGDTEKQLDAFNNKDIFYLGEIPLSQRADYEKKAEISDIPVTYTYFFNTNNKLFEDADVRRALSMALDREQIAEILTYASPATGLIPTGVFNYKNKGDFRTTADKNGALISSSADVDGAKSLLKSAGVTSGSFTITIRDNEVDKAVADYVSGVWNDLGFRVKVNAVDAEFVSSNVANQSATYNDTFQQAYNEGDFDVIAVDYQMLTSGAFQALASFATEFSGNGVDMDSDDYDAIPHVTGYSDSDYDELIESAYNESDLAKRAEILHQAEEKLMNDMPVAPLAFMQDAYLINSSVLKKVGSTYFGRDFRKMKMNDFMKYKESIEALQQDDAEG